MESDDEVIPMEHRKIDGYDYMPAGWCGACEICDQYPAPEICEKCTYSQDGWDAAYGGNGPIPDPVEWPCEYVCPCGTVNCKENDHLFWPRDKAVWLDDPRDGAPVVSEWRELAGRRASSVS